MKHARIPEERAATGNDAVVDSRATCPLCGYKFAKGIEVCVSCGLGGGCDTVGCPHCGYAFPTRSVTYDFFTRWYARFLRAVSQRFRRRS